MTGTEPRWARRDPSAIAHLVVVVAGLALVWWVALTYRPLPISDFHHYWLMASEPAQYAKGGAWIVLLMPLKALGLSPHVAAALVHTGAWLGLAWVLWDPAGAGSRVVQALATFALACLAAWFAGLWGIVANDVVHVAVVAVAAALLARTLRDPSLSATRRRRRLVAGVVVLGLGLSVRMQSMPVAFLVAAVGAALGLVRDRAVARRFVVLVGAAMALAIVVETALRAPSTQPLALYNRITLYNGLLATDDGPMCGRWTEEALAMTREDLDQPLFSAARRRLADRGSDVPGIVRCKVDTYLHYTRVGVPWLRASARPSTDGTVRLPWIRLLSHAEHRAGQALKLLLAGCFVVAIVRFRGRRGLGLAIAMPLTLVLGYVALHAVVEIQERYIIEPVVLGLTAAWLALTWPSPAPATTARSAPG